MQENRSLAIVTQIELRQSDPQIREAISGPLGEYFQLMNKSLLKELKRTR